MAVELERERLDNEAPGEELISTEAEEWEHYMSAGQEHRDYVTRLHEGMKRQFAGRNDRLVMSEVPMIRPDGQVMIPDVAVVEGLAQSARGSYRIGTDGPPPRIVIEVVSPTDTEAGNRRKLDNHLGAGTGELWFLHLLTGGIERLVRDGVDFRPVPPGPCEALGGVRFEASVGRIEPRYADGTSFPGSAAEEAARADQESARAREQSARAREALERAQRLAAKLAELGVELEP